MGNMDIFNSIQEEGSEDDIRSFGRGFWKVELTSIPKHNNPRRFLKQGTLTSIEDWIQDQLRSFVIVQHKVLLIYEKGSGSLLQIFLHGCTWRIP